MSLRFILWKNTKEDKWCSVQMFSHVRLFDPIDCSMPAFPVQHQLPELAQTHVHQVSDAIQLYHPLSSPSPPTFNLSQHQGLFKWVSSSHKAAKILGSFSFIISPSNEYSEIIFFRIDRLDLLPVKGILNNFIQHHSSEASILQCSAFFIVQLSQHDYWKNHTFD